MKNRRVFGVMAGALVIAACIGTAVRADEAVSVPQTAASAAAGSMTAKSVRQANRALRKKIYAALARHKEIDAGTISITAKSGAVTINGTVPEAAQIDEVAEIAKQVPGVTSLNNRLTVQRLFGQ